MMENTSLGDIFISYSRSDTEFVDQLELDLKKRGYTVWVDRRKLEGGQTWNNEIRQAIKRCQIMLVVISPDAAHSRWVNYEWRYALKQKKSVIPIDFLPTPNVSNTLKTLQQIDFRASVRFPELYHERFDHLVRSINRALEDMRLRELAVIAKKKLYHQTIDCYE